MKKLLICLSFFLTGCPMAMDFTIGLGANQNIKKTLDIQQKQTKSQSDNQTTVIEDIINVIPFLTPEPTLTPQVPKVKSVTIEMEGHTTQAVPTPTPIKKKKITAKIDPCTRWVCADSIAENCVCENKGK